MATWVTIKKHAETTGYTAKAIRAKIERGVWLEGAIWRRQTDGRILISEEGYDLWAEGRESELLARACNSISGTRASGAGSD